MKAVAILRQTRANLIKATSDLTENQLMAIPDQFNNNILWNLGHVLVTQQLLIYKLSGQKLVIDLDMVDLYRKGSFPSQTVSVESEYKKITALLHETVDQLEKDLETDLFDSYETYSTSYGLVLNNVSDAVTFNNVHEGMHLGYVLSMKHLVA